MKLTVCTPGTVKALGQPLTNVNEKLSERFNFKSLQDEIFVTCVVPTFLNEKKKFQYRYLIR